MKEFDGEQSALVVYEDLGCKTRLPAMQKPTPGKAYIQKQR